MNKKPTFDLKERIRTALSQSAPVPKMQNGDVSRNRLKSPFFGTPLGGGKEERILTDAELQYVSQSKSKIRNYINSSEYANRIALTAPSNIKNNPDKLRKFIENKRQGDLEGLESEIFISNLPEAAGKFIPEDSRIIVSSDYAGDSNNLKNIAIHELGHARSFNRLEEITPTIYENTLPFNKINKNSPFFQNVSRDEYNFIVVEEVPALLDALRNKLDELNIAPFGATITREDLEKGIKKIRINPEDKFSNSQLDYLETMLKPGAGGDKVESMLKLFNTIASTEAKTNPNIQMAKQGGFTSIPKMQKGGSPKKPSKRVFFAIAPEQENSQELLKDRNGRVLSTYNGDLAENSYDELRDTLSDLSKTDKIPLKNPEIFDSLINKSLQVELDYLKKKNRTLSENELNALKRVIKSNITDEISQVISENAYSGAGHIPFNQMASEIENKYGLDISKVPNSKKIYGGLSGFDYLINNDFSKNLITEVTKSKKLDNTFIEEAKQASKLSLATDGVPSEIIQLTTEDDVRKKLPEILKANKGKNLEYGIFTHAGKYIVKPEEINEIFEKNMDPACTLGLYSCYGLEQSQSLFPGVQKIVHNAGRPWEGVPRYSSKDAYDKLKGESFYGQMFSTQVGKTISPKLGVDYIDTSSLTPDQKKQLYKSLEKTTAEERALRFLRAQARANGETPPNTLPEGFDLTEFMPGFPSPSSIQSQIVTTDLQPIRSIPLQNQISQSQQTSNIVPNRKQGGMAKFDLKERINRVIQEGGNVSAAQQALGYKDNSPYKNMPYQDIYSDRITMKGVSQPLAAVTDNGISTVMQPGGEYYFPGANVVREIPVMRRGGLAKALGYMPTKFQNSGNTSTRSSKYDENDGWIREILTFENIKGRADGTKHPRFGYNEETLARLGVKSPKDIDEAIAIFRKHYLPKVLKYPLEDRKRMADMLFNAGEDARIFQIDKFLGGDKLNRKSLAVRDDVMRSWMDKNHPNVGIGTAQYNKLVSEERARRTKEIDRLYDQYKIGELPEEERVNLLDEGRKYYYQNIDKVKDSKTGIEGPNPAWEGTWKYRVSELFQPKDKRPDYIKKMYAETPDLDIQPTQQRTASQPAAPVNQGAATNAQSSAPPPVNTNVRQQNAPRETYAPGRGIFNVAEMPTTNETFTNRRGVETLVENRDKVSLGTTLSGISIIRSGDKVFLEKDGRVVPTNINAQPSKSNAEVLSSLSNGRTTDEAINNAVSILWNDNRSNYSIPSKVFYGDVESNYPNFRDIKSGYEKSANQNSPQLTEEEQSQLNRKETLDLLREAAYNLDIHNKFDQKFTKEDIQKIVDKAKETRTNLSANILDLLENNDIDSVVNDLNNTESLRDQFGRPKRDTEKAKQVDELAYKDYYEKLKKYAEDNGIEAVKPEDRAGLDRYLGETKQKLGTTTAQSPAPAPVDTNVKPSTSTAAANQSATTTTPTTTNKPDYTRTDGRMLSSMQIEIERWKRENQQRRQNQAQGTQSSAQSTQSTQGTQSTQITSTQGTQSVQGSQVAQGVQGVQGAQASQSSPSSEGDYINIKPIYAKDPYEYRYNKTTGMWETKQKIKQTWIVLDDSTERYRKAKAAIIKDFQDQIPARNINDVIQAKTKSAQGAQSTQGIQTAQPSVAPIQGVQGAQTVKPTTTTTYWVNGGQVDEYSTGGKTASGMLSGAATGAALGTAVPVIGNIVGAVGGALIGGLSGFLSGRSEEKAKKEALKAQAQAAAQQNKGSNLSSLLQLLSSNNSFANLLQGPRPPQNPQPTPSYSSTPYTGGMMSPGMAQLLPPPFQDGAQVESPIYTNAEQPTAYSIPSLESNFGGGNQKPVSINMDKIGQSKGSRIVTFLDPKTNKKRRAYIDANGNVIGYLEDEEQQTNKQGYDKTIEEAKDYADKQAAAFNAASNAQGTQPVENRQQGGPAITSLFQRNMARNNQIKNNISMNKMKLEDVINLSRGVNPFRMQPQGVYKSGGLIMEGGVSPSRAGFSRQPISGASSTGPLGPRRTETPDYNNNGVRSILDLPSNEYIPTQNMVPIQAEIGEMIVLPTGDLMPVMARKRHHQMKDDEVTDITPENSYILSAHGEVRINKDEADLLITETGVKPYRIGTKQNPPTEKTLASIMTKKVMRPAEVAKRINSLFPVLSTTNPFELAANVENKINRKPYLEGLIQLSEIDKLRKGLSEPAETDVQQAAINQGSPMLARQGGRMMSKPGIVKAQNSTWTGYPSKGGLASDYIIDENGNYILYNPDEPNNPITIPAASLAPLTSNLSASMSNIATDTRTKPDGSGGGEDKASGAVAGVAPFLNLGARLWAANAARKAEKQGIARERGIYDQGFSRMSGLMGAGTAMEAAMLGAQNPFVRWQDTPSTYIDAMRTQTPQSQIEAAYNRGFANLPDYSSLGRMGLGAESAARAQALQAGSNYLAQAMEADRAAFNQQQQLRQGLLAQNVAGRLQAQRATDAALNKILSGYGNLANRYTQGQMNLRSKIMDADIGLSRAEQASKTGLYGNRVNAFTTFTSDLTAGADDLLKILGMG